MTQVKFLPRDDRGRFARTFTANGRKYVIRTQEEGIGILRYSRLLNMSSVWGLQADLGSQLGAWRKAVGAVDAALRGKASFGDFYAIAQNAVNGVNRAGETNYLYTYWTACLFVVREGEDMTTFTEAEQQEKIDDWAAEGLHESDFEELVKKKLLEFSGRSNASSEKEAPTRDTSSGATG